MSKKQIPEPDFLLRSAGLFLCEWPDRLKTGEAIIAHLEAGKEGCVHWQPFEDYDTCAVAQLIESNAITMQYHWKHDFDDGMKWMANDVLSSIRKGQKKKGYTYEHAQDLLEALDEHITAYLD